MPRSRGVIRKIHRPDGGSPRGPDGRPRRPIITLTTDFGTRDFYVPVMKAVLLRHCPDARLIDVTHHVPRHDVLCGSITLERAVDGFPPGTVHLAVIDPGVGTDRRLLVAEVNRQTVVCPDNGLLTWPWRRLGRGRAYELTWRPAHRLTSNTFHGRDILAPAAGMLAAGTPLADLARPIDDPVLLDVSPATDLPARATVIHIDHFGNATTNLSHDVVRSAAVHSIRVKGRKIGKVRRTYWDVAPGKPLALIGSSGLLEIAVRDGSAAEDLKLKVGDEVVVE
jgi:S-adenosylmethionine hydrolase